MNLFVVTIAHHGVSDLTRAESALRRLVAQLPYFYGDDIRSWRGPSEKVSAAWVTHRAELVPGASYAATTEHELAMFAGRPIRWISEQHADGRSMLDAQALHRRSGWSAAELDGRFVGVRYSEHDMVLEVMTDPVGAYPAFETECHGGVWISNNAELLHIVQGKTCWSLSSLAGVVGGGWPLDGNPLWEGVKRIPSGGWHAYAAGQAAKYNPRIASEDLVVALRGSFDASCATHVVVEGIRALADWPGRASVIPTTAGRDSRVVLAAANSAGVEGRAMTGGWRGDTDVEIGRMVARATGRVHELIPRDRDGDIDSRWRRGVDLVRIMASGTATLPDAASNLAYGPPADSLVLWHSGQGGEIARAYYGSGEGLSAAQLVGKLYDHFAARRAWRHSILSLEGEELVRTELGRWVTEQLDAGIGAVDVPDVFYVRQRMGMWAGPGHGVAEGVRDMTSPLWSARLIPHQLGMPLGDRVRGRFHWELLRRLAPELLALPFEDGYPWRRRPRLPPQLQVMRRLAPEVARESRRRFAGVRGSPLRGRVTVQTNRPLAEAMEPIRDAVLSQPGHAAWAVLDRRSVERLLRRNPAELDVTTGAQVWRLATVFIGRNEGL